MNTLYIYTLINMSFKYIITAFCGYFFLLRLHQHHQKCSMEISCNIIFIINFLILHSDIIIIMDHISHHCVVSYSHLHHHYQQFSSGPVNLIYERFKLILKIIKHLSHSQMQTNKPAAATIISAIFVCWQSCSFGV